MSDIVMSVLAVYTGNLLLAHSCSQLLASGCEASELASMNSAIVYVFTYSKLHPLVRYAIERTNAISLNLAEILEHDTNYFDQVITFSEFMLSFVAAMGHGVDKLPANAIKNLTTMWGSQPTFATMRLFVDFGVPQKVLHCFHAKGVCLEAASFVFELLQASSQ
jgi:hypothetical protein